MTQFLPQLAALAIAVFVGAIFRNQLEGLAAQIQSLFKSDDGLLKMHLDAQRRMDKLEERHSEISFLKQDVTVLFKRVEALENNEPK